MNRRGFTKALIAAGLVAPLTPRMFGAGNAAFAAEHKFQLQVVTRTIEVNGRAASVFGLVNSAGKPGLDFAATETAQVELLNQLDEPTMIHWHGLTPPWEQDGVPDAPMPLLDARQARAYALPTGAPGTHWMHAHTLQEQALLAAPLIVRGKAELARDEQDVVILLHDFSFTPPAELLARLTAGSAMPGMDHSQMAGMDHSAMPMGGAGMAMDLNDIEYDAYLANDRTLNDPEVFAVEKGGWVRVRIINGATATAFTIDTGALSGEVIAVDGQDVVPLPATTFPLAMGQRVDFRLRVPAEGGAFPILALREGAAQRTGVILATAGAAVPKLADTGEVPGPVLTLETESRLVAAAPLDGRQPDRRFTVDLTGTMDGYRWGMAPSAPLVVGHGQRVAVEMRNMSMMAHPMHLHGHHFQIVALNGQPINGALRDTVFVPPMTRVTFAFDAANPGGAWAFHCHHL
ncbi:MAG TPA: multicopper oxidase domain-containing protein, partial [Paracoccaceae bacterium]